MKFAPVLVGGAILAIAGMTAYSLYLSLINSHKLNNIMASQEEFESVLARIDTATNDIAEDIRNLKGQIEGQGLPRDVENRVLDSLNATAEKLEGIGSSVENPVPDGPNSGNGNGGQDQDTTGEELGGITGSTTL